MSEYLMTDIKNEFIAQSKTLFLVNFYGEKNLLKYLHLLLKSMSKRYF